MGMLALLVISTIPAPVAAATMALPSLGTSMGSVAALGAAGAAPRYGSYWVGDWILTSGWGGFDNAMKTAKAEGVTPVIYHYYWGDSISPTCFGSSGCNGRTEKDWHALTDQLAARVETQFAGAEVLIVLENEFNKGGITGDFAPTFDSKLEAIAKKLNAVSGVKLILGFGSWGESNWVKFPKSAAQSEYIGFQMMRASTKDTETSYRAAADRSAYLTNHIAQKFDKPSFLYDVALSSYPDAKWEKIQAETLDAIFQTLKTSGNTGLQGVVYRSLNDHYMSPANYYGYAESHWGLRTDKSVPKPAFDVWLEHAKASTSAPTAPVAPNVPGAFEGESMDATKGGKRNEAAASGGAAWNLWSNGQLSTTLVADKAQRVRIDAVAMGQSAGGVDPVMEIRLAGGLLRATSVAPGAYHSYSVDVDLPSGSTQLSIHFTNDAVIGTEDRNLIVDVVRIGAVPVNGAPIASFSATTDGLSAAFDASASSDPEGVALSYAWDFGDGSTLRCDPAGCSSSGDGSTGAGVNAVKTYAQAGTYTVTLSVRDGSLSSTRSASVTVVAPNTPPTATFAVSATHLVASFDATASSDDEGDALSYAWGFGDGTSGTGATATREYASPGTYTVTLTVSDAESTAVATKTLQVTYPAPIARAVATGSDGRYVFDASGSADPAGGALTYAWSFGDGTTGAGAMATKTYAKPGDHTVKLTVANRFGDMASTTLTVSVAAPEPYAAEFTPVNGNNWWVQVRVDANAPTQAVCASVDGGSCKPLELKSWGDWAASFHVPTGAKVTFTATSDKGERVTSGAFLWPTGEPAATALTAKFTPLNGNNWWVQTKVASASPIASVCAAVNGGSCTVLKLQPWGDWAGSFYVPTGAQVRFTAADQNGAKAVSSTYTWPVK